MNLGRENIFDISLVQVVFQANGGTVSVPGLDGASTVLAKSDSS